MHLHDPAFDEDEADDLSAGEDLIAQATLWVVRLTAGDTTAEDRREFQRWRDESPAHAAALVEARSLWVALGPALRPAKARRQIDQRLKFAAIAASLVACAVLGAQALQTWNHDYVTGPGQRREVALSDGTHVMMSGDAALDVRFKDGVRKVSLARGEAYFDVVHDPSRPFSVAAGAGEVHDIGTAFSVRRAGRGADVVVARGEVEVAPTAIGAASARLTPDQAVSYGVTGSGPVRATNAAEDLSWTHGLLILKHRSLAHSVGELNRYYAGRLLLLNGATGAQQITAVVDLNHIDDWLTALNKTRAAKVARMGSLVLIY